MFLELFVRLFRVEIMRGIGWSDIGAKPDCEL